MDDHAVSNRLTLREVRGMRAIFCGLLVLAAGLPGANATELAGTWEGRFTQGTNNVYAGFDLDVTGDNLTGAAFVEGWGSSRVSEGHVDGDRFQFTVDRKFTGLGPVSKIAFKGTVSGKSIALAPVEGTTDQTTLHRVESHVTGPVSEDAPPTAFEGTWTARFVGRIGDRPKMIGSIDFDFKIDGNKLTGVAHMGGWPGDCPISEGRVENGHFSFTATGLSASSTGLPVMWFEGEIHGNQLKLTMHHQIFGGDNGVRLPMDAVRK
jgi:hypothetical protein